MDKEKKIEDLLASIYKLVQEAKVEKENILSKNNLNLKKNFENKKEKFIDVVYKSNDSKNSENYILENSNEKSDFSESELENRFKSSLSNWSEKKLKFLFKEEFGIFSKSLLNSKLK